MKRGGVVLTVGCALPVLLPVLLAAPAHADSELGFSVDGRQWQPRLTDPLFDPALRWVPGDVRTARFLVRNEAPDTGAMTVDVVRARRTSLIESGFLRVTARAGDGPWTPLDDGDVSRLVDDHLVDSGRPVAVQVRVAMDADAPNGTMVLSTDLDFRVTLRDALAVSSGGSGGSGENPGPGGTDVLGDRGGPGGTIPDGGSSVPPWLPPLALGLVGAGTWLVVRRRVDEDDDPDTRPPRLQRS